MKPLQNVTRERAGSVRMFYLSYTKAKVAKTLSITKNESIAIDVDAQGEVIGIELVSPGATEIELLGKLAQERGLSLDGLLGPL